MKQTIYLEEEKVYHIYNRAVGNEKMFIQESDYIRFLDQYGLRMSSYLETLAYCLLPNHFHIMVKVSFSTSEVLRTSEVEKPSEVKLHQELSNFFNSYAKYFNLKYERKRAVFMHKFKRKVVEDPHYFSKLLAYIHSNPVKHELVTDLNDWTYSSYHAYTSLKKSKINTNFMIDFFGSRDELIKFHKNYNDYLIDLKGLEL